MINEHDDWTEGGQNILAPETLSRIALALEQEGPVILEHRFYRGSRSPDRLVFDDYADLLGYVKSHAKPGDHFYAWSYAQLCREDNSLVAGKYPDALGRTPRRGAY